MAGLQITGANQLSTLAVALKRYGDKGLEKDLYAGINRATRPLIGEARKAAEQKLPRAGGLNKRVAGARMSTKRLHGKTTGVRVVASGMDQLALIDKGKVRHPVWGNRGRWVNQPIPEAKGWFTETIEDGAEEVGQELAKVIAKSMVDLARRL